MHQFTVLILPAALLSVDPLRRHVEEVHPGALCLIATDVGDASFIIQSECIDLFLVETDIPDGDTLDLLFHTAQAPRRVGGTLVLTGRNAARILVSLRALRIEGVFDSATETPAHLERALRMVETGRLAWSDRFVAGLHSDNCRTVMHQLSPREQLGLAILGDGCSDRMASDRLAMALTSVRSMRQDIYGKIGAHGTDDVVRLAVQLGYTRFSARGLVAMGLSVLVHEYTTQSKRPTILPRALLESCGYVLDQSTPYVTPLVKKQA